MAYNVDKFIYLGTDDSATNLVLHTRKIAGLNTLEKLRSAKGIRFGAHSVGHDTYIRARIFSWFLDLKESKFVTGYSGPDLDVALAHGEVDATVPNVETVLKRNGDWIEKKLMDFHIIDEIPRGYHISHSAFDHLPVLESYVKNDRERKLIDMFHNLKLIGSPYVLPPGTSKEHVQILSEAMRKTFRDPEFAVHSKKMTGGEASPLLPEEQDKAIKQIPRDPQIIELFKKIIGGGPLPPR